MLLRFQLPLPDKALSPNARGHWSRKMAASKTARTAAKLEALRVFADHKIHPPKWGKARWYAIFWTLSAKRPDPDNAIAMLKPYLDGLADAGVVTNDRDLWPERPQFQTTLRLPRVEIFIGPES